jgi:hypothetical protein
MLIHPLVEKTTQPTLDPFLVKFRSNKEAVDISILDLVSPCFYKELAEKEEGGRGRRSGIFSGNYELSDRPAYIAAEGKLLVEKPGKVPDDGKRRPRKLLLPVSIHLSRRTRSYICRQLPDVEGLTT